jgi:hypothetical protein
MRITIDFEGRDLLFTLDADEGTWTAAAPGTSDLLEEGDFPFIGTVDGKRYELYSDGTFAEAEL